MVLFCWWVVREGCGMRKGNNFPAKRAVCLLLDSVYAALCQSYSKLPSWPRIHRVAVPRAWASTFIKTTVQLGRSSSVASFLACRRNCVSRSKHSMMVWPVISKSVARQKSPIHEITLLYNLQQFNLIKLLYKISRFCTGDNLRWWWIDVLKRM